MDALETYLAELSANRAAGAVPETSGYGALANLLNEIGHRLKPRVRCVINPANRGAGIPDGGLFVANQFEKGRFEPLPGQMPGRGALEVKGVAEDAHAVARRALSDDPAEQPQVMKLCIVGASGKLGQYMVEHALDRGYEVVAVCREGSVEKLAAFKGRITVVPGAADDREVIRRAVAGCDGVLVVLAPMGVHHHASGTAQAVLDYAPPGSRLVFSCGWHISRDGQDVYSLRIKVMVKVVGRFARLARMVDLDDQVEACRRVFASDTRWTVVRGSDLEEGESQGLPVWSRHVGDPILKSNMTRRVDFALFMVEALQNDELVHEAPAIVGCKTPSAFAHTTGE